MTFLCIHVTFFNSRWQDPSEEVSCVNFEKVDNMGAPVTEYKTPSALNFCNESNYKYLIGKKKKYAIDNLLITRVFCMP